MTVSINFRVEIVPFAISPASARADRFHRAPFAFVIRGEPAPGINPNYTRRLLHPTARLVTGDFHPRRRAIVSVDMGHIARPSR